jgi:diacylglycerol kinase (ATP)
MVKALLIHNPVAGSIAGHRRGLSRAVDILKEQGWQVTWRDTEKPGDATRWARDAVTAGYDVVIAAGGDGTVGQVADGLAGSQVAMGILPLGTSNVLARELGLARVGTLNPFALETAAQMLLESQPRRVDLGWANGRHFFNWAGVGLDAEIIKGVESQQGAKRRLGLIGFLVFAAVTLRTYAGMRARVRVDGRRVGRRLILVLVSNIELYGRYFHIAPRARLDDGLLDVCCFHGQGLLMIFYHVFAVLLRRHLGDPRVSYYQAREVEIETSRPLSVQVDGDPYGTTPLVIRAVPQALTLLLPPRLAEGRFVATERAAGRLSEAGRVLQEARRGVQEARRRMEGGRRKGTQAANQPEKPALQEDGRDSTRS